MLLTVALLCTTIAVKDGDTFFCGEEEIRLKNMDAPESYRAKCEAELMLASAAKRRLQEMLAEGIIKIVRDKRPDRYGRTIAIVYTPKGDVGQRMIDEGFAREWTGKREPWCR